MNIIKTYPTIDRNREFTKVVSNRNIHYFIPPELVINEYESYCIKITKSEGGWVTGRSLLRILEAVANIDIQEWYDICILGLKSTAERPRCKNCDVELPFRRLSSGYGYSVNAKYIFCSNSCCAYYRNNNPEEYPDYNEI